MCEKTYGPEAWAEIFGFIFDVGEYGQAKDRMSSFILLQENLVDMGNTYRDDLEAHVSYLVGLCFMCGAEADECVCHPQNVFTIQDYFFVPQTVLDAHFYHSVLALPNVQYMDSCYNCTKQYSLKCEKLPEQLLTIGLNHRPAYKLDTCEYIDKSMETLGGFPTEIPPF
jgi:hypothetical protein